MKQKTNRALEMPETARSGRLAYSRESLKRFSFRGKGGTQIAKAEEGEKAIGESLGMLNNDHCGRGFKAQSWNFSGEGIAEHG